MHVRGMVHVKGVRSRRRTSRHGVARPVLHAPRHLVPHRCRRRMAARQLQRRDTRCDVHQAIRRQIFEARWRNVRQQVVLCDALRCAERERAPVGVCGRADEVSHGCNVRQRAREVHGVVGVGGEGALRKELSKPGEARGQMSGGRRVHRDVPQERCQARKGGRAVQET